MEERGLLYIVFCCSIGVDLIHIIIIVFSGEYERQQNSLREQTREQQVTVGEVLAYPWSLVEVYSAHPLKVKSPWVYPLGFDQCFFCRPLRFCMMIARGNRLFNPTLTLTLSTCTCKLPAGA